MIKSLIWQQETFNVAKTNRTTTISLLNTEKLYKGKPVARLKYIYSKSHMAASFFPVMKEMREMVKARVELIKAAEQRIKDNTAGQEEIELVNSKIKYVDAAPIEIEYFSFKDTLYNIPLEAGAVYEIENVIELDITKAYYRACFNLGYITNEFYEKCIKLPKSLRLRLIGSIATMKTIERYIDGVKQPPVPEDIIENKDLREVWFKLCSYVSQAMKTLRYYLGPHFLFYWVDGVYFKNFDGIQNADGSIYDHKKNGYETPIDVIIEILKRNYHFECKVIELDKFTLINYGVDELGKPDIRIQIEKSEMNGKGVLVTKKKLFTPPGEQIVSYELTDEKEFN